MNLIQIFRKKGENMAGTWETQNKILPGAYFNFKTNAPLSITPGERGIVVLLQEMSVGDAGDMYTVTARGDDYPVGVTDEDKLLANEALKGARTVIVYNLGRHVEEGPEEGTKEHEEVLNEALAKLMTVEFNVLVYPYDGKTYDGNKDVIKAFVEMMRSEEGVSIQSVLANYDADSEAIINVTQGVKLSNNTALTPAQCTAWVGGVTAGASITKANTNQRYIGAIDVEPRMTKTEMENAITAGEFIFKVDSAQNVTAVSDINSLTTITEEKGKRFQKNRIIRVLDGINNDVTVIFESNYVGKSDNTTDGRSRLRAILVEYFNELQKIGAIQNFVAEDVTVSPGKDSDAVVIDCYIQPVDAIEKIYTTVNLQ